MEMAQLVGRPPRQVGVRLPRRSETHRLRSALGLEHLPSVRSAGLRRRARRLVTTISEEILTEVTAYAGPAFRDRAQLVYQAVSAAVGLFVDLIENEPTTPREVSGLFRELGHDEAVAGRGLDGFRAALDLAMHRAAETLSGANLPGLETAAVQIRSALLEYMAILHREVRTGHEQGRAARARDPLVLRRDLADLVIEGGAADRIRSLAMRASWRAPTSVAVCAVDAVRRGACSILPADCLWSERGSRVLVVVPPHRADDISLRLAGMTHGVPVVLTATVPLMEVPAAVRWAERAQWLVRHGVIPADHVVRCADHHAALLLHADPSLSRWEANSALSPLDSLRGEHRRAVARTLLEWLSTGASARALSERLDIHEHTVRNHKQVLDSLFGRKLDDPEFKTLLLFALAAERDMGAQPAQGLGD